MLKNIHIQGYKSLYDTSIDLEPLTVFIGANGSGKSNILEALQVILILFEDTTKQSYNLPEFKAKLQAIFPKGTLFKGKFWQGNYGKNIGFAVTDGDETSQRSITIENPSNWDLFLRNEYANQVEQETKSPIELLEEELQAQQLRSIFRKLKKYDFNPFALASVSNEKMNSLGAGITNTLADILYDDREKFIELEKQFTQLIPHIERISLNRDKPLSLVDKFSDHKIPASEISDGTLRILGFLAALYDVEQPNIICFEEPENGVHPWLLQKMMDILQDIATRGIAGKPVQILITTHSPTLLNYVKPEQIRAVELDAEGKTQVHKLPLDSAQFNATMEAFEGQMGELWFTNIIEANPVEA